MNLIVDTELSRRRWPEVKKSRKQWPCDRCGGLIEKGCFYEYSRSVDMEKEYRLCMACYSAIPLPEAVQMNKEASA